MIFNLQLINKYAINQQYQGENKAMQYNVYFLKNDWLSKWSCHGILEFVTISLYRQNT